MKYSKKAPGVARKPQQRQTGEPVKRAARQALNEGTDAAIKIYKAAARLKGGPRDGRVYYVDDLRQEKRATEAMGRTFDYVETRAKCVLPWTGGVEGVIWKHRSAT